MKKLLSLGILLLCSAGLRAQNTDTTKSTIQKNAEAMGQGGNNEIKINLFFSVAGLPEIAYERLLEDNMGVGIAFFVNADRDNDYRFGLTPHYRLYFGQKKAAGFFIEGNAAFLGMKSRRELYYVVPNMPYNTYPSSTLDRSVLFGMGAAIGGKFLTRNGFLGEIYSGVGRIFDNKAYYHDSAYPRVGITIGKRF